MNESKNISKLFADLYNGNPWTCIKLSDILDGITADQAASRPIANANTIWQLVNHCVGWRENVLRKLHGEDFKSPEDNYLSPIEDTSLNAWNALLDRLKKTETEWEDFLKNYDDKLLHDGYKPSKNEFTNYEVIHGILHHDNYHFGQISMLKKLLK
ncbi:MAG: DinB family protein [Chitinophagales bacterium]